MKRSGRSRNWNQDIWLKDMQVLIAILSDWLLQMICDKNYKYSHFNPEILSYIFIHTVTIWWIHTDTHCSLVCESVDWKQKLDRSWLFRASLVAQTVKNLPVMLETQVQSLSQEYPLEEKMATPSSIFAWKTPWTEKPGRLESLGLQRVRLICHLLAICLRQIISLCLCSLIYKMRIVIILIFLSVFEDGMHGGT